MLRKQWFDRLRCIRRPSIETTCWMAFFLVLGVVAVVGEFSHTGSRLSAWMIPVQIFAGATVTLVYLLITALVVDDLRHASAFRRWPDVSAAALVIALFGFLGVGVAFFYVPEALSVRERLNAYFMATVLGLALSLPRLILAERKATPAH